MKTGVVTKSSRTKSARGGARREHEARRQRSANRSLRDTVVALIGSLKELEATCVKWLERDSQHLQHSQLDGGAAVQALDHLIARTERMNRAWRETAERDSQWPQPEKLAGFRCQDCDARFLADQVFDVARKTELALLVAGHRAELTPADEMLAESFEARSKWMRCPECASSNICFVQEEDEIEAGSMETVIDVAGEMLDDLKPKLSHFAEGAEARVECMNLLWSLCATLSRGCELVREYDKLDELKREFGREERGKRWVRWIEGEEDPPASPALK
jgi:hypothetical protein